MTSIRSFVKQLLGKQKFITIVSGLPRSGTSMMMAALKAGGMDLVTDHIRTADANNPKGYYEFERVKKLPKGDNQWLILAKGKALKVISALLEYLPGDYQYRILFMERDIEEILASQQRMLDRTGKEQQPNIADDEIRQSYQEHLEGVCTCLNEKNWFQTLYVSYNGILCNPMKEFRKVAEFLSGVVDPVKMAQVVDPTLYREKG
jgi:hypothetical protein